MDIRTANGLLASNVVDVAVGQATAPVPEPASLVLLGGGLLGCVGAARRRNAERRRV